MVRMKLHFVLIAVLLPITVNALNKFICSFNTESISCTNGFVIKIRSVNFGRTSKIVCSNNNVTNCYSSGRTTAFLASSCNGRNVCQLTADSNVIGEDPCPNVPKYLDLQYDCDQIPTTTTTTTTTTMPPVTQPSSSSSSQQVCHEYLVSGPRGVPDNKLTASSTWSNNTHDDHSPRRSRLFTTAVDYGNGTYLRGAWSAGVNNQNQYIQAELNSISVIRGVVTQGSNVNPKDNCCYQKVTKYRVQYSVDGVHFKDVEDGAGHAIEFGGNQDQETPSTNMLPCPVVCKFIRIIPLVWTGHMSLRFDAIGCPTTSHPYGQCPVGWIERPGSNTCYLIDTKHTKGWDDARQACRLQQGDLIKIETIQEKNWVLQELTRIKATLNPPNPLFQVWTGLSNRPRIDSQNWKWQDGVAHNTNIVPWLKGMPDNYAQIEHCAEFVNGGLNDVACNSPINYICKKSKYWNQPTNKYTPVVFKPTTPKRVAPTTAQPAIPTPIGGGGQVVQNGANTFIRGCNRASQCFGLALGDYQSCQGCHYYLTCAPSGNFVRPCPATLVFDYNAQACVARSGTCLGP